MAKKSNFKKIESIKDTKDGGFGTYEETNGGGTPRGGIWGGQRGRIGWDERLKTGDTPSSAHREKQPRTADGKWTYNSVNGKETKYESRGETVNPLLTGGENGVKINEVSKQFTEKSGNLYDKYKDKFYVKGSEKVTKDGKKYKISISNEDIWEIARGKFDVEKGMFVGESEAFDETKRGRHSAAEKAAIKEAKTTKGETYVKDSGTGGIATKKGTETPDARAERIGRIVDYLKGKYGLASEAMIPGGSGKSKEELAKEAETAKSTFTPKVIRKSRDTVLGKSSPSPFSTSFTGSTPAAEPEAIPEPEEAPENKKEYSYIKGDTTKKEITPTEKYDKESIEKFKSVMDASEELGDEDKAYVEDILTSGNSEAIDELLDSLVKGGFVTL